MTGVQTCALPIFSAKEGYFLKESNLEESFDFLFDCKRPCMLFYSVITVNVGNKKTPVYGLVSKLWLVVYFHSAFISGLMLTLLKKLVPLGLFGKENGSIQNCEHSKNPSDASAALCICAFFIAPKRVLLLLQAWHRHSKTLFGAVRTHFQKGST